MSRLLKLLGAFALALSFIAVPTASYAGFYAGVGVNLNIGPPALPIYDQPPCPEPNLIWTPGYWSSGPDGYYWVPGTWVAAPEVGYLWTPGYWGYGDSGYNWNAGYWGTEVGFYGGIDYGNGYSGNGYNGGRWRGNRFNYNTAYSNVNRNSNNNTYNDRSGGNGSYGNARSSRVSYNGGPHGVDARANSTQLAYTHQSHAGSTSAQRENAQVASGNRNYLATVNHGRPTNVAFARPLTATNRPHSFAPLSTTARTQSVTAHGSANAYRAPQTSHAMSTYHAPAAAYHAPAAAYHAPAAAYHAPAAAYHAPAAYHPAYQQPAATYHAPAAYHPAYQPAATYHAPAAYHGGNTMSAPRGGGMPQGGGPRGGGGGAPHGGGGGGAPHGGGGGHPGGGEHR